MTYTKISINDRECVVGAFRRGENFILLAGQLGIKERTARHIVELFVKEGRVRTKPKHKRGAQKVNKEMVERLVGWVQENAAITLVELRSKLMTAYTGLTITQQAISGHLDKKLITVKQLRSINSEWNSIESKQQRHDFATWFINEG